MEFCNYVEARAAALLGVSPARVGEVDHVDHQRDASLDDGGRDLEPATGGRAGGVRRRSVREALRRRAGGRVVLVGVPRTDHVAVLELAVAERAALMRTA